MRRDILNDLTNNLVDPEKFDRVFYWMAGNTNLTHQQIFNALNKLHEATFGIKKWSSYDSYRVSRNRRINR